jgi:hypothetical protein
LDSIYFHLIVMPCEIPEDSHEIDFISLYTVLLPYQPEQLILLNLIAMRRRRKNRSPSRFEGTVR